MRVEVLTHAAGEQEPNKRGDRAALPLLLLVLLKRVQCLVSAVGCVWVSQSMGTTRVKVGMVTHTRTHTHTHTHTLTHSLAHTGERRLRGRRGHSGGCVGEGEMRHRLTRGGCGCRELHSLNNDGLCDEDECRNPPCNTRQQSGVACRRCLTIAPRRPERGSENELTPKSQVHYQKRHPDDGREEEEVHHHARHPAAPHSPIQRNDGVKNVRQKR